MCSVCHLEDRAVYVREDDSRRYVVKCGRCGEYRIDTKLAKTFGAGQIPALSGVLRHAMEMGHELPVLVEGNWEQLQSLAPSVLSPKSAE